MLGTVSDTQQARQSHNLVFYVTSGQPLLILHSALTTVSGSSLTIAPCNTHYTVSYMSIIMANRSNANYNSFQPLH